MNREMRGLANACSPRILVIGVNPFEDIPGYQVIGLLRSRFKGGVIAADDSQEAIDILRRTGIEIHRVPHPRDGTTEFVDRVLEICDEHRIDLIMPAADAPLAALSRCVDKRPDLASRCPPLRILATNSLFNKWAIQDWISSFTMTPMRWPYRMEADLEAWERGNEYPVMVKGMRKGAEKCRDHFEAVVAFRHILKNPANCDDFGGAYLEAYLSGEEYSSLVIVHAKRPIFRVDIRKLATTSLGTTLAAELEQGSSEARFAQMLSAIDDLAVVEIESRRDSSGQHWVFEVNFRFPSWIGCLGDTGSAAIEAFIRLQTDGLTTIPSVSLRPGTIIYRLPEAGPLPLVRTFNMPNSDMNWSKGSRESSSPLWRGRSPHQFLVK